MPGWPALRYDEGMIKLFDAGSDHEIGTLTEAQFTFLQDHLEEESEDDQDYYINGATIDVFEAEGADRGLVDMLRRALGEREEMDVRWTRD
jgi:processive 1,2-diacylglycerol beta-glucosyltransferase